MANIKSPFVQFYDIDGQPLEDGYIYIGTAGLDPATNAITVYSDANLATTVTQPVRTIGGFPVVSGSPVRLYVGAVDFSIRVSNKNNTQIHQDLNFGEDGFGGDVMFVDSANDRVGIGTATPDGTLHVHTATAGSVSPSGNADDLTVEGSGNTGISILNPTASDGFIMFGSPSAANAGVISYSHDDNSMTIQSNASVAVTIDSSGNVGIGTSSPTDELHVDASDTRCVLRLTNSSTGATSSDGLEFAMDGTNAQLILKESGALQLGTASSEVMRLDSSGNLLVGKTSSNGSVEGTEIQDDGQIVITRDGGRPIYVNRLTSDGLLMEFAQDNTVEGDISISGTTVSLTGAHLTRWSQLTTAGRPEILRGSVMSNLDEMCVWPIEAQEATYWTETDGLPEGVSIGDLKTPAIEAGFEDNEQLNKTKVSDVEGDKNVAGVFQGWDDDDDATDDFYVAMTGDFIIRIAQGTTVQRGDLLMSAGDGTAKPQTDDAVKSCTIAKVTSTHVSHTYDDGSYCVPCVLMAC